MQQSDVPFFKIFIVGLGLIGGSIGLTLRGKMERIGYDLKEETMKKAVECGAIDRAESIEKGLSETDVTLIAIPVQFIPEFIETHRFREGSIVMDTGSTKQCVIKAMKKLPENVYFVGAHPLAGKEKSGIENADKELFKGKLFILSNERRLTKEKEKIVLNIVKAMGSIPVILDSETHDFILGLTSHLPYIVSLSLFLYVMDKEKNIFAFAGSGLRDVTRIASGDPVMSEGMIKTNSDNVKKFISEYIELLKYVRDKIDTPDFERIIREVKKRRDEVWG